MRTLLCAMLLIVAALNHNLCFSMNKTTSVITQTTKIFKKSLACWYATSKTFHKKSCFDDEKMRRVDVSTTDLVVSIPLFNELALRSWGAEQTKKVKVGINSAHRECIHRQLKLIESERNWLSHAVYLGIVHYSETGGVSLEEEMLEHIEHSFMSIVTENPICWDKNNQLKKQYSFGYFNADELIKLLDAGDDGDCSSGRMMKP